MDRRLLSRRKVLRGLAGGLTVAVAMPLLAACGGDEEDPTATMSTGTGSTPDTATEDATPTEEPEETDGTATSADGDASPTLDGSDATKTGDATVTADGTPTGETPGGTTIEPGSLTGQEVTVYSGRSEELVGPILAQFEELTGATVNVQYASSAEMAATLLEEGENSPADLFYSQEPGALGALANEGMLAELPEDILGLVDPRFSSRDGLWVGLTARARAVVYNTEQLSAEDIPESILDFTDPEWSGRLGWVPSNASFQSFVTALRVVEGEDVAREWLEGIQANDPYVYANNGAVVQAVIDGEIDAGFVNHYYLERMLAEAGGDLPAENYIYTNGDPGALVNATGVGILTTASNPEVAETLVRFLLTEEAQTYFADETFEYPLLPGVPTNPRLVPLDEIETPDLDLSQLEDLEGTLELLTDVGLI